VRTLFALAVLIVMSIGTAAYLRRRPADAQTVNEAGDGTIGVPVSAS